MGYSLSYDRCPIRRVSLTNTTLTSGKVVFSPVCLSTGEKDLLFRRVTGGIQNSIPYRERGTPTDHNVALDF